MSWTWVSTRGNSLNDENSIPLIVFILASVEFQIFIPSESLKSLKQQKTSKGK